MYNPPVMHEPPYTPEVSGLLKVILMICSKMIDLMKGGNVVIIDKITLCFKGFSAAY